jgi:carbonic anhydrase/acetyltransferase-like protein (isoleucine patch superfamily)
MAIYQLDDLTPAIHEAAWVADNAQVLGNVRLAQDSSVWFGVVIRGDMDAISVGRGTNIQDNSVLHADHGVPLTIGDNVSVGHQVMLHGCTIGDGSLIGIQAVILNGAKIGKNCLVGAGSLVTEGKEFPDNSMIFGSPAKAVRQLSAEQIEGMKMICDHYVENARRYKAGLKKLA